MSNCEFHDNNDFITDNNPISQRCLFTDRVDLLDDISFSNELLDLIEIDFNLDSDDLTEITNIVNNAVALAGHYVDELTGNSNLEAELNFIFGDDFTLDALESAWNDFRERQINIEIVSDDILDGFGAFGDSTIFLAEDFITDNDDNLEAIASVFLEEAGHYLDDLVNTIDTLGDEGELFANWVMGEELTIAEIVALQAENDRGTITLNDDGIERTINVEYASAEDSGVFTVGDDGKVTIDFLFDSGSYSGELAVFSLEGIDAEPDSVAFREAAVSRALSNSELGYVVVSDPQQGAKFSGELGEANFNQGNYSSTASFSMNSGDLFAVMLVPNGTVQAIADNSDSTTNLRPLFSIAEANPGGAEHFAQFVETSEDNGGIFAVEDLRIDRTSDRDYNDLIFQVRGGKTQTESIDNLIDAETDWRDSDLGQQLNNFAESFDSDTALQMIFGDVGLVDDTGVSDNDNITNDVTISGNLSDDMEVSSLKIGFSDTERSSFVEIGDSIEADGSFSLDLERLAAINDTESLVDGNYNLHLIATDDATELTEEFPLSFTLDTQTPALTVNSPTFEVTVTDDLRLTGSLEDIGAGIDNLTYSFNNGEEVPVTINDNGEFDRELDLNTDGLENSLLTLSVTTTDIAGNITSNDVTVAVPITVTVPTSPTTKADLQYVDLQPGNDVMPKTGQQITVHYTGTLEDGTQFDSSRDRDTPFTFTLGIGQVIAGWDAGVATMTVGSRRRLIIPSALAYGETGAGGGLIPPNATLIFDVELLSIA